MDSEIVYLELNNWIPSDNEMGMIEFLDRIDDNEVREAEVCVAYTVWDLSLNYWVTCKRSWLEKNFPELINNTIGRQEEHLDWKPENYGYHFFTE